MATKEELKEKFGTGKKPTGADFALLIDGVVGPEGPKGETGADGAKGDKGNPGTAGSNGVSVTGATSDGTNITFTLSEGEPIVIPWPTP